MEFTQKEQQKEKTILKSEARLRTHGTTSNRITFTL